MKSILLATVAVLACSGAFAAPPAHEAMAGATHGGQLRMAGALHLELVVSKDSPKVRENPVVVHVTDHTGQPVATAGGSGKAQLKSAGVVADLVLRPDGGNRFKGFAKYASDPGLGVSVTVVLPGQTAEQARFQPLAKH
jgi:hypothetical protein